MNIVVTVDGVAGAGKSTAIQNVKVRLKGVGLPVLAISSGHLYRAVALLARLNLVESGGDIADGFQEQLIDCMHSETLLLSDEDVYVNGLRIPVGLLKEREVTALTPFVAQIPAVRDYVNRQQVEVASSFDGVVLVDGRDGGNIFPNAKPKLFLAVDTAQAAARLNVDITVVAERNRMDRMRDVAPMIATEDAVVIDTTQLSETGVVAKIIDALKTARPVLRSFV